MSRSMRILAVNPGSTSTKIAVFEGEEKVFSEDVVHDAKTLEAFHGIMDQLDYRRDMIVDKLKSAGYELGEFDAFSGRGGSVNPCGGGTYRVTERVVTDASANAYHPATLGSIIVNEFAHMTGKPAFMVNPPDVDEFQPVARITGVKDVYRESRFHALSHKEVGKRAAEELGKSYENVNLIIAHIGGGVSVAAHKRGKVVDANDALNGDGPMAPTRSGMLAPGTVVEMCFSGKYTKQNMKDLLRKNGGLVSHFGTSDVLEVVQMIRDGNAKAELVFNAMIYGIAKYIGSFAAVLHGEVDAIVLTGGIARSDFLVAGLKKMVRFIADFIVYPGEFEMDALAHGAYRVLTGAEEPVVYTGEPVWTGEDDYKGEGNGV